MAHNEHNPESGPESSTPTAKLTVADKLQGSTSPPSRDDAAPASISPSHHEKASHGEGRSSIWRRASAIIFWTPPNCRWDPAQPPKFSMGLNVLFAFAGAFTVANLYYNHPLLNLLAHDFDVPYDKVAQIPTLAQAGYAIGLLFLGPLGDLLKRRPFVLALVFFTATLCIGLCVTKSLAVFSAIQFISGVTTVTPQLMMPLVGDLAPPSRRGTALSIVTSGLMLGILMARLLSGVMANYTSWRNVYWLSVALQYLIFALLWLFMPDYPSTNPGGLNYFKMLWSIPVMLTRHPVLVQACIVSFFTSSTFTNFWTVLTFLLSGAPYHYSTVVIGLFALVGIASMFCGPVYARVIIDRFVPLFSVVLGLGWCLLGVCLGTYLGSFTVAGPILQAFFNDFGLQTAQIANRSSIYRVEPKGRNRVNTAFMVFTFCGQLLGTAVGARLYTRAGWIASGSYSVAAILAALAVTMLRGPWEEGWVGWHGGWRITKANKDTSDGKAAPEPNYLAPPSAATADSEEAVDGDVEKSHHPHSSEPADPDADESEKTAELAAAAEDDSTKSDHGRVAPPTKCGVA